MTGNIDFEAARRAAACVGFGIEENEYRGMPHISAFAARCADGDGRLLCDDEPTVCATRDISREDREDKKARAVRHTADCHDGIAAQTAAENAELFSRNAEALKKASENYLDAARHDTCNAYITLLDAHFKAALEQLCERLRQGDKLPLAGVPISVKDNICVAFARTSCASRALCDWVSPYDATVYSRLIAAGAIPVGKTNMDEFAVGSDGTSSFFGACKNPLDASRTPGGSSSGSAASVAAGSAVISLGSDTGGSARLPAVYCGLCALKPSYGAFSRYGLVGMAPSLEQISPIARCVDDLCLTFEICAGEDGRDLTCASFSEYLPSCEGGRPRVAVFLPSNATREAVSSTEHAAALLRASGCMVEYIPRLPCFDDILGIYYTLSSAEATSQLARYDGVRYGTSIGERGGNVALTRTHTLGAPLRERLTEGAYALTHNGGGIYNTALRLREHVRRECDALLTKYELLLTPASDSAATPFGHSRADADRYAVYANLTSQPAVVLPCGVGEGGLPMGIQLTARRGADRFLLREARRLEKMIGGAEK